MEGTSSGYRVLFVEDHVDTRLAMTKLLRRCGFSVESEGDCAAAIAAAKQQHFDVLVADIGLPDGSGLHLLSEIRQMYPINGIVMSGYGTTDNVSASRDAGFSLHLTKPIDATKLCEAVEQLLRPNQPALTSDF